MKYAGMPFGMWTLFAPSFRNQLTAVFGYGTNTNCSALKKDAESLPRPQNYLALSSLTFAVSLIHDSHIKISRLFTIISIPIFILLTF